MIDHSLIICQVFRRQFFSFFRLSEGKPQGGREGVLYGRRNGAKLNESKSLPTSTTNQQFNIFFTSTIKSIQLQRLITKIPLFFNAICLTTNIVYRLQQQNKFKDFSAMFVSLCLYFPACPVILGPNLPRPQPVIRPQIVESVLLLKSIYDVGCEANRH